MQFKLIILIMLGAPQLMWSQDATNLQRSENMWQQDIAILTQTLSAKGSVHDPARGIISKGQKDFRKLYPRRKFDRDISELETHIGTWSDDQIALELAHIVAGAHVAHNKVILPHAWGFKQQLPVAFEWYSDGLLVTNATKDYKELFGTRVTAIGTLTPNRLQAAIAPYVSYENAGWLRTIAADMITLYPILKKLGAIDADGLVPLTLSRSNEESITVRLPFVQHPDFSMSLYTALKIPRPLRRMQWDKNYFQQYLENSQTGYIGYRRCANDPAIPFADFVQSTLADFDKHNLKRIVIDLRENEGGNSSLLQPLVAALKTRSQWKGHIYVLIGPQTFSSAMLNAIELKMSTGATLIGEPTGGKPGSYGEVERLELPNTKLVVIYTLKYFHAPKAMTKDAVYPDILAALTISDILAGRDPALTAAFAADEVRP